MKRDSEFPISSTILNRHSPRAMSGESMSDEEIMPLFEAAKWAPSCYNSQPWRFIYAKRETPHWKDFLDILNYWNQKWAKNSAVLTLLVSTKISDHNQTPLRTHSFDCGAAWENLAIEGSLRGYVVHAMGGFDHEKAKKICLVPDHYQIETMISIGKKGEKENLPEDIKEKEILTQRRPLKDLIYEGKMA